MAAALEVMFDGGMDIPHMRLDSEESTLSKMAKGMPIHSSFASKGSCENRLLRTASYASGGHADKAAVPCATMLSVLATYRQKAQEELDLLTKVMEAHSTNMIALDADLQKFMDPVGAQQAYSSEPLPAQRAYSPEAQVDEVPHVRSTAAFPAMREEGETEVLRLISGESTSPRLTIDAQERAKVNRRGSAESSTAVVIESVLEENQDQAHDVQHDFGTATAEELRLLPQSDRALYRWESLVSKLQIEKEEGFLRFGGSSKTLNFGSEETTKFLRTHWAITDVPAVATHSSKLLCVNAVEDGDMVTISSMKFMRGESFQAGRLMQRLVVYPSSYKRLVWELLSMILLVYDFFTLPLEVFDYESTHLAEYMRIVVTIFWTFDLVFTFFCGFIEDGHIEMKVKLVWARYLKSWFLIDLLVVSIDWALLFLHQSTSSIAFARVAKATRFIRVLRVVRFIQKSKMAQTYSKIWSAIVSEALVTFCNIAFMLLLPVVLSHFIACAWYWLGMHSTSSETWVNAIESDDRTKTFLYWTAFHWAIAQYTPAPNNIHPVNLQERIFAISVLLIGFIVFTSFVGSVTSLVTTARNQAKRRLLEESQLRRFIHEMGVSFRLSHEVTVYTRHIGHARSVPIESDVELFKTLPETVLVRLHFECYVPVLRRHPLIRTMYEADKGSVVYLAHASTRSCTFGRFNEIFNLGSRSHQLLFVTHGCLKYRRAFRAVGGHRESWVRALPPTPSVGKTFQRIGSKAMRLSSGSMLKSHPRRVGSAGSADSSVVIEKGDWICEPALWLDWFHTGYAAAPKSCNLLSIHVKDFTQVALEDPQMLVGCRNYARSYVYNIAQLTGQQEFTEFMAKKRCWLENFDDVGFQVNLLSSLANDAFFTQDESAPTKLAWLVDAWRGIGHHTTKTTQQLLSGLTRGVDT
mmetsp:Transcript_45755/g.106238  ORF Transcript_45755/g.106238 Transcript_45755/m.106238 type:complete len:920 (+) Transcript_45755:58-2817(+)